MKSINVNIDSIFLPQPRRVGEAAGDYMLSNDVVLRIVNKVLRAVSQWRIVTNQCGISSAEQKCFAARIESNLCCIKMR